jgi:hypothetical protein
MYALDGGISGGGPKDKSARELLYRSGWQPYSIKIGDTWYAYGRLEPIGTVLGITADMVEMGKTLNRDEKASIAGLVIGSIGKNLANKTFLKSISDIFNVISDPDRYGEQYARGEAGTIIPSLVAQTAKVFDPTVRRPGNLPDYLATRIPGLSGTVMPKRDLWGKEINRERNIPFSPIQTSTASKDPINKEMVRLFESVNFHPGEPAKKIKNIELTPEEYDQYSKLAGEMSYRNVGNLMEGRSYLNADDTMKSRLVNQMLERARDVASNLTISRIIKNDRERYLKAQQKKK